MPLLHILRGGMVIANKPLIDNIKFNQNEQNNRN